MSRTELNEERAIRKVTSRKQSTAYQRAVDANVSVTYAEGENVVRVRDGKRTIISQVVSAPRLQEPKIYTLK